MEEKRTPQNPEDNLLQMDEKYLSWYSEEKALLFYLISDLIEFCKSAII